MAYYQRVDEPSPSGGAYSEMYCFDDDGNYAAASVATRFMIHECTKDGMLIKETLGFCNKKPDRPLFRAVGKWLVPW